MNVTETRSSDANAVLNVATIDMKLEVVIIPVSDVDRAKRFYATLGWRLDGDVRRGDSFRGVQFTPKGSGCSIQFGTNLTSAEPGSAQALHLVVSDVEAAREDLIDRGVETSEVFHCASGYACRYAGNDIPVPGPHPERGSYGSFLAFSDPDGNGWLVQEVTRRFPGRVDEPATYPSPRDLAQALRRAEAAHRALLAQTRQSSADWPDWYADYLVREQSGQENAW
jgi:catechol 2,3-dioxygenase-like lactoylglutathione lyase family enzyme